VGISIATAHRAKTIAYKNVEGSYREQYKLVYDYAHELLKSNPGSTMKVSVEDNEDKKIFRRLYVCLKACKDSFVSCKPIIGLDGCFLKEKYGGELLTAVARKYEETYTPIIYPVNGPNVWEMNTNIEVMPPAKRILPGRPKKKRRLESWELRKDDTRVRLGGTRKRCAICRQLGHKRNSCPKHLNLEQMHQMSLELRNKHNHIMTLQ